MNKITFLLVFISGASFSIVILFLHKSLLEKNAPNATNLGVFSIDVDLDVMDDGYIIMENVGPTDFSTNKPEIKKESTEIEERNSEIEALNSLKAAKELVRNGRNARAGRLLEHAYSLMPKHPEVLICYGEYLEDYSKNVVQADQMYLKALAVSPKNSRALRNRRRTQKVVEDLDSIMLKDLDLKQEQLTLIPGSSGALRRIKKEAYFHYIYHTAGIEGNTFTLTETRMVLETKLGIAGKSILEHNEILGLDLALRFINSTLVKHVRNITMNDLLQIHKRVLGHSNPLDAGIIRTTQVYVSDHVPPPPSKLQLLLENFIEWLNSKEARQMHPVKYATLAHYKLVYIHPFVDGNGRTARLLMNYLLMQAGYPPVIIRKQDRLIYYSHLQAANEGDTRPFIRFVAHCADKTMDVYLWATKEHIPEIDQEIKMTEETSPNRIDSPQSTCEESNEDCRLKSEFDSQSSDDSLEEENSGDSWLHGEDPTGQFTKKEYVQFKHYRSNIESQHIKRPPFLFDSDDDVFNFDSGHR